MKQPLSVSIVIPTHNEADTIYDCLKAIEEQTIKPYEVILVDNNSTDATVDIASRFSFVTLMRETRQGVVHARNTGFDVVIGEIIGRIDGDTIISPDWVESLRQIFTDENVSAVTGATHYRDMLFSKQWDFLDRQLRHTLSYVLSPQVALQGANMAIRRSTWRQIRTHTCAIAGIHEDFDIGLHAQAQGMKLVYDVRLKASLKMRQLQNGWLAFARYVFTCPQTYMAHKVYRGTVMYPIGLMTICMYPLLSLSYNGYDKSKNRFSVKRLFAPRTLRVNPATYVE